MLYHERYQYLRGHYHAQNPEIDYPDLGLELLHLPFHSQYHGFLPTEADVPSIRPAYHLLPDGEIIENQTFTYPVLRRKKGGKSGKAILLLHGLNERTWDKYLPWAAALVERTGHPVILFPISFHMNRAPAAWNNPRRMQALSLERKKAGAQLADSTYANAAISERLEEKPERFFLSGLETYLDLITLIRQMRHGKHPLFRQNSEVSFFGYSIGAFLAEILLMANPDRLLSQSKSILFCGGATFDLLQAASKFIMDSRAFGVLKNFWGNLGKSLEQDSVPHRLLHQMKDAVYFKAMLSSLDAEKLRGERLGKMQGRVKAFALLQDRVYPPASVFATLGQNYPSPLAQVEIFDFPYPYSHENPFPHANLEYRKEVDRAFNNLFDQAAAHLQ